MERLKFGARKKFAPPTSPPVLPLPNSVLEGSGPAPDDSWDYFVGEFIEFAVWVHHDPDKLAMYDRGCFGKGTLSRSKPERVEGSEPTGRKRKRNKKRKKGANQGNKPAAAAAAARKAANNGPSSTNSNNKASNTNNTNSASNASNANSSSKRNKGGNKRAKTAEGQTPGSVQPRKTGEADEDEDDDDDVDDGDDDVAADSEDLLEGRVEQSGRRNGGDDDDEEDYDYGAGSGSDSGGGDGGSTAASATTTATTTTTSTNAAGTSTPARKGGVGTDVAATPSTPINKYGRAAAVSPPVPRGARTWVNSPPRPKVDPSPALAQVLTSLSTDTHVYVPPTEFLQLGLEEAMFLTWAVDVLSIYRSGSTTPMSAREYWAACRSVDRLFVYNYAVYHHFRAKGWVVKSGVKYGGNFILYREGPQYYHSEFTTVVVPCAADRSVDPAVSRRELTWPVMHDINRMNEQVSKEVLFVYVIEPEGGLTEEQLSSPEVIRRLSIQEVALRRWVPSKHDKQKR